MGELPIVDGIAEWAARLRYEDLPRRVVEEAKNQILSMIAAVHAGHFSDAGRVVSRTVKEWTGAKEATLIPSGERTSARDAIFGNAALAMALDYDDYLFAGHTGHSSVLVTLALAEKLGVGGRDFLVAQVLANEIEGRIGASALLGPLNGQMWAFIHLAGSAAVTAKLMDLDRQQIANAIALAMAQPPYPLHPGFFGSDAKVLLAATAVPAGVQAAELAANGLRGARDIFEGDQGFLQVFAPQALRGAYEGLGKVWLTETLSYKIYPGCAYIDAFVDCLLALARQHHIDARKVRAVHIAAGPLTLGMDALAAPYVRGAESVATTLNFSVAYNAAVALIDRELSARQFVRDRIKDPAVWDLATKVQLRLDDNMAQRLRERSLLRVTTEEGRERYTLDLGNVDLNAYRAAFGAHVRVEMEDGRSFEMEQEVPYGGSGRPFDELRKIVEDKFRRETRYTLRKERMEKAIDQVHHLENASASHLRELVRTCCSERV
jgi:2-methylcitrate dehydratase PrpD